MFLFRFFRTLVVGAILLVLSDTTNIKNDEVKSTEFLALYKNYQTLHLVDDYFRLIQSVSFKPIVANVYEITDKVKNISQECRLDQNITAAFY